MCIAILCPKGTEITAQQFRNCWDNNFNGAGFMYNDDKNTLRVVKEMDSFDKIYSKYKSLNKKFPDATFVVHFRISTHGVIDKSNCHPFKVSRDLGFVHNGVISTVSKSKEYSDTNVFNREILQLMPNISIELLENPAIKALMSEFISYSKLVFMDRFGKTTIINEHKGAWEQDGIWYSNDSHKRVKNTVDFGGKTVSREELKSIQCGGSEKWVSKTSTSSKLGYARSYDDWDDHDLNGSTYKYPRNQYAKKGKSYRHEGKDYLISDGSTPCICCGQHTLDGELLSSMGECFECLNIDEATAIMSAAVIEGAILSDWNGTVVSTKKPSLFDDATVDDDFEPEVVECDNCTSIVAKKDSLSLKDWGCTLCANCVDDFIDAGALHESTRINTVDQYGRSE